MKILFFLLFPMMSFALPSKNEQFKSSLDLIVANATRPDVKLGMVVASPSRENPDYYYDWVRDTALTFSALIDYYKLTKEEKYLNLIKNWVFSEFERQNEWSLTGLGEPKFYIDGKAYSEPWGRPQNDGPALRAIAMIKLARILLKDGDVDFVSNYLYRAILPANSIIKKDLEYTAHQWREASFDLWEEEKGMHFYTLLAQYTALKEGALFARESNDNGAAEFYAVEAVKIKNYIYSSFHDDQIGIKATVGKLNGGLWYKTSGIDIAVLLGLLHSHPFQDLYKLDDERIKKYLQALTHSFKISYKINTSLQNGIALGRYPEDRYDGYTTSGVGNPWFLSTIALAEYYCLLPKKLQKMYAQDIESQFQRVIYHSDRQGHMSEQFHRENGLMQGAQDLTWSYTSFVTAMMRCGLTSLRSFDDRQN
jgi:glucoamylase